MYFPGRSKLTERTSEWLLPVVNLTDVAVQLVLGHCAIVTNAADKWFVLLVDYLDMGSQFVLVGRDVTAKLARFFLASNVCLVQHR